MADDKRAGAGNDSNAGPDTGPGSGPDGGPHSDPGTTVALRPIGVVRSRFTDVVGMPIQAAGAPDEAAVIEVFDAYRDGLADIDGFDYLHIITLLHRGQREALRVTPFLDDVERGVFATRAPARPNRLGLSVVRLVRVEDGRLSILGNDMVDGTPVLDIKPYVPRFDVRETGRIGWFAKRVDAVGQTRADGRMGEDKMSADGVGQKGSSGQR